MRELTSAKVAGQDKAVKAALKAEELDGSDVCCLSGVALGFEVSDHAVVGLWGIVGQPIFIVAQAQAVQVPVAWPLDDVFFQVILVVFS